MPPTPPDLSTRAQELHELARTLGPADVDTHLAQLPEGDDVARVGYLADALGIDPGVAFDTSAPLPEPEVV